MHTYHCGCGCGAEIPIGTRFKQGHQNRPSRSATEYADWVEERKKAKAAYQVKWRKDNAEKKRAYQREYYKKDPERRERHRKDMRERYHADPDKKRAADLKRKYGLTLEAYAAMLEAQSNGCAICGQHDPGGRPRSNGAVTMAVDHDHTTGKIRGLLCRRCNIVIGKVADDRMLLRKAIAYLEHHQS